MLQSIMHVLKTKKIVLASSSPRRQELVKNVGLDVLLCPSVFEENLDPKDFPTLDEFVIETALQKVLEVDERLKKENNAADIIIGADTMVTLNGKLFGKPTSEQDAFDILSQLSGKKHTVLTGVVVKFDSQTTKFCEKADVFFGDLTPEQIWAYVATKEPLDKAGGYGIQGIGGTLIRRIEGDYFTIMGLPLYRLSEVLYKMTKNKTN
ncbi:dTTP/UTP pyrophosphatase [Arctopsyche grandis]|uniref:dTTP/UTP pyrophosphatase n=1 Tax=Arctopsyche grandis TaxID=121162 RepID=UPI00406D97F6